MKDIGKHVIETGEDIFDPWEDRSVSSIKEKSRAISGAAIAITGGGLIYGGEEVSLGYFAALGGALILYKSLKRHMEVRKYSENN